MAFIYDRKDGTVIEYNPMDRIRFVANDPKIKKRVGPLREPEKKLVKIVRLSNGTTMKHYKLIGGER